jgi:hypothetical protein
MLSFLVPEIWLYKKVDRIPADCILVDGDDVLIEDSHIQRIIRSGEGFDSLEQ